MAADRTTDLEDKITELTSLDGTDVVEALDALGRMDLALGARGSDAMIGLVPVADAVLDRAEAAYIHLVTRLSATDPGNAGDAVKVLSSMAALQLPEAADGLFALATKYADQDATGSAGYYAALFAFNGQGTDKDLARAHHLHERAAAKGCAASMFELYAMTSQGLGCEVNDGAASAWCLEAAQAGHPRAMANVGGFYASGQGLPHDVPKAVDWYTKAAGLGHGKAAATLGVMFALGEDAAINVDVAKAKHYFFLADDLGFDWYPMAEAMGLDPSAYA